jgi:hypothetical protein
MRPTPPSTILKMQQVPSVPAMMESQGPELTFCKPLENWVWGEAMQDGTLQSRATEGVPHDACALSLETTSRSQHINSHQRGSAHFTEAGIQKGPEQRGSRIG